MRALVTGGSGFLGRHLIRHLLAAGWRVTALVRPSSPRAAVLAALAESADHRLDIVPGDVTDRASLSAAWPPRVDVVFHLAGDTSLDPRHAGRQARINVGGTRHLLSAAQAAGAGRLVFTSSVAAWGLLRTSIDETVPQRGERSPIGYARTKYRAERLVEAAAAGGLETVILSPSAVIGAGDEQHWGPAFTRARAGRLRVVPRGRIVYNHVDEVARAHLAAAQRAAAGSRYLLGGHAAELLTVARAINTLVGRPSRVLPAPRPLLALLARLDALRLRLRGGEPLLTPQMAAMASWRMTVSSARAERDLGYRAVSLERCLGDCHAWWAGRR